MEYLHFETEREKWVWIGAFVEGEGSIIVGKSNVKTASSYYKYRYRPSLSVVQKDRRALELIQEIIGFGSIRKSKNGCCRYELSGLNLKSVLEKILPFLITKRKQAELAIEARDIIEDNKNRNYWKQGKNYQENRETFLHNYDKLGAIRATIHSLQGYGNIGI